MAVTVETLELDIRATGTASAVSALESVRASLNGVNGSLSSTTSGRMAALGKASAGASKGVGLLSGSFGKMLRFAFVFKMVESGLSTIITKSNEYVENLNLFTVAMGEYADEALKYANKVQEALGVDSAQWIRNQGVFKMLFSGYGTGEEMAATMSKNLTQLGYDIASFYNVDVATAMQKLQSGIAGQTKSVREYGYDVSIAALQEVAHANGIDEKVNSMTMSEKATLRYIALMQQNSVVQGDMSRTISSSANQLRILKAQLDIAARALGNIFIPALNAVLPYVIAVIRVIRMLAETIATLFGFALPTFDYSGISAGTGAADDLSESLDGASGSANRLKGSLASFDELNVIPQTSSGGGGGGGGGGLDSGWLDDLELPTYEFLGNVQSKVDEIVNSIKKFVTDYEPLLKGMLFGFATLETLNMISNIINAMKALETGGLIALGIAAIVGGFVTMNTALTNLALGIGDTDTNILQLIGSFSAMEIVLISIGATIGGAGGAAVGGLIGLIVALAAYLKSVNDVDLTKAKEELESYYGKVDLTSEKIKLLAKYLTSTDFTVKISIATKEWDKVTALDTEISEAQAEADKSLLYLNLGIAATETDVQTLVGQVQTVVGLVQERLDASQSAAILTLSALFGPESSETTDFAITSDAIRKQFKDNLDKLASDYYSYLEEAFADQEFTADEQKIANEMYLALQEALSIAQGMQHRQDVIVSINEFKLSDLSLDSYNRLRDEIQAIALEQIEDAKQAVASTQVELETNVEMAQYNYDHASPQNRAASLSLLEEAKQQLKSYDLDLALEAKISEINLKTSQNFYTAFVETWGPRVNGQMQLSMNEYLSQDNLKLVFKAAFDQNSITFGNLKGTEEALEVTYGQLHYAADRAWETYSEETKETIKAALSDSATAAINDGQLIENYRRLGIALPDGMLDSFNQYQLGMALAGDTNAQMYIAGQQLASSPEWYSLLSTVSGMGAAIPEQYRVGVIDNIDTIIQAINEGTLPITQTLFDNLAQMGIDLRAYVTDLPSGINTALADAFSSEDYNYELSTRLGITINTTVTERIDYRTGLTAAAVSALAQTGVSVEQAAQRRISGQMYADGGFPESGQYFLARENGIPEMVGTMGGHTAVANNDQIVEGIADGVSSANEKVVAELREQNALLRALLEKENTLEPSAAWGAFVAKSSAAYAKAGG